ncbi:hypothetical protein ACSLVQ_28750, partial [Klebsiella pneumoniae]|uniref:hypothetical protein n=1 Tax=Klebsiella pneumoniae TaxID=573 RepID=UPI003EDFD95B
LLGRKKVAKVPFGLDEKLERLGINATDLQELRPGAIRIVVIATALYAANYIPGYLHDEKVKQLDADMATLQQKSGELQWELATKKDI